MVPEVIHYLLYIAVSLCLIAPVIAIVLIRKAGKPGVWAFIVGILSFISITMLQSISAQMIANAVQSEALFYILYILAFVLFECVGIYFFTRVLVRDATPAKCLATGMMFGAATAIVYAINNLMSMITMTIAINTEEYEELYNTALNENPDFAAMYKDLHDMMLSLGFFDVVSLVLYGVACIVFFTFIGALFANGFDGKPLYFIYAGISVLVFEGPAILISNLVSGSVYSYSYQVIIAVAAAVFIKPIVKEAVQIGAFAKGNSIELNPRLR